MDVLPVEILAKILRYLDTYDLIQFCTAYSNYSFFLREKSVIRFTNFSRRLELHTFPLFNFITTKIDYTGIKTLNISYLYWITVDELRKLILRLNNLQDLIAIDTKLGITKRDVVTYSKLKKLAVSVEDNQFLDPFPHFINVLKSLCLKITVKGLLFSDIYKFFLGMDTLEELWICDDDESFYKIDYGQIAFSLSNLKKFVIKSKTALPCYDFRYLGLFKVFECKRYGSATEYIYEKILFKPEAPKRSIFEPRESEIEQSWEIFESLHKDLPCGPLESKQIYLNQEVRDIYFEDLNFCHVVILCNSKYIDAARQILSSKNSKTLRRLCLRSCLFQNSQKKTEDVQGTGFKQPRSGFQLDPTNHPFQSIAQNLRNLKELEILTCSSCSGIGEVSAYPLIEMFEHLQKLTLEIPLLLDGSFLKEVFRKCQHLQSLNLTCVGQNEKFILNLCDNLQYANDLRDFRLEHKEIVIDKLLNSLNKIPNKKLLRLFIKCDSLRYSNDSPFLLFLENNPQLIFFFLIVSKNTIKQNADIQKTLNNFKKARPAKIFYVKQDISSFTGVFPIPSAHHDMIFNRTNVSVIKVDDFC